MQITKLEKPKWRPALRCSRRWKSHINTSCQSCARLPTKTNLTNLTKQTPSQMDFLLNWNTTPGGASQWLFHGPVSRSLPAGGDHIWLYALASADCLINLDTILAPGWPVQYEHQHRMERRRWRLLEHWSQANDHRQKFWGQDHQYQTCCAIKNIKLVALIFIHCAYWWSWIYNGACCSRSFKKIL